MLSTRARFVVLILILVSTRAFADEQIVKNADGSIKSKAETNSKKQQHGRRQVFDSSGKCTADEIYFKGNLLSKRGPTVFEQMRPQIDASALKSVKSRLPFSNPRAAKPEELAAGLARVRLYRYLCNLPYDDINLDDHYVDVAQYGAELLEKIKGLNHTPSKPDGMSEKDYKLGYEGTSRSNIHQGVGIAESVDGYMDDSDGSNIDRIGHRRWVLNPGMKQTGFGWSNGWNAMYVFDEKRRDSNPAIIAFPPPGAVPTDLFKNKYAWSAQVSTKKYDLPADPKIKIFRLDADGNRPENPIDLDYQNLSKGNFGAYGHAIIVRPKEFTIETGVFYEVVISGLTIKTKPAPELSYQVWFYDPATQATTSPTTGPVAAPAKGG